MARATSNHTTKRLPSLFRDPFVAASFRGAEDDGTSPCAVEADHPRTLDGGATEAVRTSRVLEIA